jgi:hypothetical protein
MKLTAKKIIEMYDSILVLATDGKKYHLKEYFAFVFEVKNKPNNVLLDTGGQMDSCYFFEAQIEDFKLLRLHDNGKWGKIATLEYPIKKEK